MSRRPRALTDEEFLSAFRRVVARLDTHIQLLDQGIFALRDDLATVLRILVCRGRGDDGLRKFSKRFGVTPHSVFVSSEPPTSDDHLRWAVSSLPSDEKGPHEQLRFPHDIGERIALVVRVDGKLRSYHWERVVADYGNTFGAHLSTTVPAVLDQVRFMGFANADFGTFMLRSLAVLAAESALPCSGPMTIHTRRWNTPAPSTKSTCPQRSTGELAPKTTFAARSPWLSKRPTFR